MKTIASSDYYLSQTDKYWKQLGRLFKSSERILPKHMNADLVENVTEETYSEFKVVLAELPYIGGDANTLTFVFVSSAAALAYIRVLERYELPTDKIGVILNEVYHDVYASLPGALKWVLRKSEFSSRHRNNLKAFAKESQRQEYSDNWVMEFVEGNGSDFDYGCNYTECAVLKFYRKMGAEKYMPYVCVMDFTSSNVLGTGLHRTKTLFYGGDCCDFRFKQNRSSKPGIPLEELPEYKNRNL